MALEVKKNLKNKLPLPVVITQNATEETTPNNETLNTQEKNSAANIFSFSRGAEKEKKFDMAISEIEKNHGKGTVMLMGDTPIQRVPVVSTGILGLDLALGAGGVPIGRIVEIYGPESSGKTTLTLFIAAQFQKRGGRVAFIDAEHALDVDYAKKLGVDIPRTAISQPDSGEQALEIVDTLVRSGSVDLVIVDSVAALTPKAELEGEMGASHMGLQARLMSQALRKLTGSISQSKCTVIFINQLRSKFVMFGSPETTTGGNALKFYASVRLDIRRGDTLKDGEVVIGSRPKIKVVKNKIAPPFKETNVDIIFGEGYSQSGSILDCAAEYGVVEKTGAWYSYKNEKIGQGRENAKIFLNENLETRKEIEEEVLRRHFDGVKATKAETEPKQKKK